MVREGGALHSEYYYFRIFEFRGLLFLDLKSYLLIIKIPGLTLLYHRLSGEISLKIKVQDLKASIRFRYGLSIQC